MPKLELWLIRHGESSINAGIWSSDPARAHLTDLGKEQAQLTARQVVNQPNLIITSPLLRAQESASYIMHNWPQAPTAIWPIQELIYLSPSKLQHLSATERKEQINSYWQKGDPEYCDGSDAESFVSFLHRASQFHSQVCEYQGFLVAVGHGQFFKAYQLGLTHGFEASRELMHLFRQQEIACPMRNSELVKVLI